MTRKRWRPLLRCSKVKNLLRLRRNQRKINIQECRGVPDVYLSGEDPRFYKRRVKQYPARLSGGFQSPAEINAPRGCAGIRFGRCQLTLTRIPRQFSRARIAEKDLESILLTYLAGEKRGNGRPELYVIHRIDQPVDGIVLFAKNKKAAADLTRQLTDGSMKKIYRAEVAGTIPSESGILEDFLVKDGRRNMSSVVRDPKSNPGAKRAKLSYRKIGENSLEIELFTGRHHQIRVQLAHAGMPIVGDRKYGGPPAERLMLTAYRLNFINPESRKLMEIKIDKNENSMDFDTAL